MAKKLKNKIVPFDRTANEVEPNVWEWRVGECLWRYYDGIGGINTWCAVANGPSQGVCYCKNLDCAAHFAEGHYLGATHST